MTGARAELRVDLQAGPDLDAEEMAQLTGRLRSELLDLDVITVELAAGGEAPGNSKGVGLLALGGLVVSFVGQDVFESVIGGIRSWLSRQRHRSIKLTLDGDSLELTGVSSAEQDRLVDLWVTRHAGAG